MRVRKTPRKARIGFPSIVLTGLGTGLCVAGGLLAQEPASQVPPPRSPWAVLGSPSSMPPTNLPAPSEVVPTQAKDEKQPPALPPTKVEGVPTPPTTDQPAPPTPQPPFMPPNLGANPLSSGGVFSSPTADGYRAGSATAGTKVNVPLIDYPGSIGIATQDTIRDQQALGINDLVKDFGAAALTFDPRRDSLNVRGFELQSRDIRWNGFLDPFTPFRDLANIQRIELLKGPSSFLYGAGQPSGILNYITKTPLATPSTEVTVTGGSFGLIRTTVDTTGAMDQSGQFLFRLNAAYEHADSFRDFGFDERTLVAPVFTWIIDPQTVLKVEAQYTNDRRRFDTGVVAIDSQIIEVPRSRFLNQPDDSERETDYKIATSLYHQFDDCWTGRIGGFVTWLDAPEQATAPFQMIPGLTPAVFGLPPTTIFRQEQDLNLRHEQYYSIIAELNGKFDTGCFRHNLLLGTELGYLNSKEAAATSDPFQPVPFVIPPFPLSWCPFLRRRLTTHSPITTCPRRRLSALSNLTSSNSAMGFMPRTWSTSMTTGRCWPECARTSSCKISATASIPSWLGLRRAPSPSRNQPTSITTPRPASVWCSSPFRKCCRSMRLIRCRLTRPSPGFSRTRRKSGPKPGKSSRAASAWNCSTAV